MSSKSHYIFSVSQYTSSTGSEDYLGQDCLSLKFNWLLNTIGVRTRTGSLFKDDVRHQLAVL